MVRKIFVILGVAFLLNFFWEEAHAILYIPAGGEVMTHTTLFYAVLFAAMATTLLVWLFLRFERLKGGF